MNFKKDLKTILFYLGISFLMILPQFSVKYPGLADDGSDLFFLQNMKFYDVFLDQVFADPNTRPMKYFLKRILTDAFSLDVNRHYFVGAIVLSLVCFLAYKILEKLVANKKSALYSILILFLLPNVYGNLYRLGTDYPWQSILFLAAVYLIVIKKKFLGIWVFSAMFISMGIFRGYHYYFLTLDVVIIMTAVYLVSIIPSKFKTETSKLIGIILLVLFFLFSPSTDLRERLMYYHNKIVFRSKLFSFLMQQKYENTSVFVGIVNYETVYKINLYLDGWCNGNVKKFYPNMKKWTADLVDDSKDLFKDVDSKGVEGFKNSKNTNKVLITNEPVLDLQPNYTEDKICANSWLVGYRCPYYIYSPKDK